MVYIKLISSHCWRNIRQDQENRISVRAVSLAVERVFKVHLLRHSEWSIKCIGSTTVRSILYSSKWSLKSLKVESQSCTQITSKVSVQFIIYFLKHNLWFALKNGNQKERCPNNLSYFWSCFSTWLPGSLTL